MDTALLIIISSIVFVLALWVVVGLRHLSVLQRNVENSWEFVDEKIRVRHDIAPLLVEIVKDGADGGGGENVRGTVGKLIERRGLARATTGASSEKSEKEFGYVTTLDNLIQLGRHHPEVLRNHYYLDLKKEFDDLNKDIENRVEDYNDNVRLFNGHRNSLVLRPLGVVFRVGMRLEYKVS
ncbi:hypothetical protein HOE67_02880 [Candidatus Peregrinibacteria bacterium]|jgi:LemA protein|nr:hypothetical protein [Candidatus Peregrinibacteria bacterium]MBT4056031.1 hypothetical protein [Candidatus Peregrinibacteria bacterium]